MEAKCPKCFNNSFKINTGEDGKLISECLKCGAVAVFQEEEGRSVGTKPAPATAFGKGVG